MVLLILTINGKQAQGGEVIWLRLHRNQKENEHQHLIHTKSVRNACCPSAELTQRLLCASTGFQQLASVGNSGPGHVPPKSHLPRLSGASKRTVTPVHEHMLLYPFTGPDLPDLGFKKAKDNPAGFVWFFFQLAATQMYTHFATLPAQTTPGW